MLRTCALTLTFVFISALSNAQESLDDQTRALMARAASLELNTKSVPPPGNPLEHHASGFAKVLCSAVFVTGLEPEFAAESIGYFTAPYEERAKLKWRVDRVVERLISGGIEEEDAPGSFFQPLTVI